MALPNILAELALSTRPTELPTWIDATRFLRGPISLTRGRPQRLARFQEGTLSCVIDNTDRRFDQTYEGALTNLCTNPSAETNVTGWAGVTNGDGIRARINLSPSKYGNWALMLSATTGTENDLRYNYTFLPNTQYTVSAWFYIDNTGGVASVPPYLYVNDGGTGAFSAYLDTSIVGAWQRVSVTFTTSATAGAGYVDAPRCLYNITELIGNGGFETAGGGGADVFGTWGETAGDGAIADETVLTHGGGHAAKLTSGPSANTVLQTPDLTCVAGRSYTFQFWARGDGVNAGRYHIYDVNNATYLVPWGTSTGVPGTSYQLVTATVTTPVGCTLLRIYLLCGPANGAVAYFDDVSTHPANLLIYTDGVQIQLGALTDYIDGAQDNGRWAGTAHASQSYRGGPYYGLLKANRRFRLSLIYAGVTYRQFTGYTDGWPAEWSVGNYHVPFACKDGFKALARALLSGSYPEELSGDRLNRVLDAIGWTTGDAWILDSATNSQLGTTTILAPTLGDRYVMLGKTTIQADTLDKVKALQHMQDVELAENGMLLMGKDGAVMFYDRHYLLRPPQTTPKAVFGDDPSELPFVTFKPSFDDDDLANEVICTRKGGTDQTASDATSKLDNFLVSKEESGLLANSDAEMLDRANWLLSRLKDPAWRIKSIVIDPEGDDRLWPVVLSMELGDRITVNRRPDGGALMSGDYNVKHIEISIDEEFRWRIEWQLSPADPTKYWHVTNGDDEFAPYAVLGLTTVLSY